MITLWDVEGGLPQLDKYLYSQDQAVVAGALLGVGIVNANVRVNVSATNLPPFLLCPVPANLAQLSSTVAVGLRFSVS